jgi:hypothetical protein
MRRFSIVVAVVRACHFIATVHPRCSDN